MSSNTVPNTSSPALPAALSRQSTRRGLVAAWALCCLAFLALGLSEIVGMVWFVVIALTLAVDTMLYIATHRVTDRPTSALDEREQTVRNRAYRTAYLASFYAITVVVGGAMLLFFTGNEIASHWLSHPANHSAFLTGLGLATLQIVSLLPTAVVAWAESDEPDDGD